MENNWIKCSDRLPESSKYVLVIVEKLDGEFFIPFTAKFENGLFIDDCSDSFSGKGVTHWMELPKPPTQLI